MSWCNWCSWENSCPSKRTEAVITIVRNNWWVALDAKWRINPDVKAKLIEEWITPCKNCVSDVLNGK